MGTAGSIPFPLSVQSEASKICPLTIFSFGLKVGLNFSTFGGMVSRETPSPKKTNNYKTPLATIYDGWNIWIIIMPGQYLGF